MIEREKIINIIEQNKYCDINTAANCRECKYNKELENYKDMGCGSLKAADALIAANIGDMTEWKERAEKAEKERDECKERAERMHKEALKQKQRVSDLKHSEDTMRNQLECAMSMVSEMEHAKGALKILYMSGAITEEAFRDAVKQAKLEIEEEEED